MVTILFTKIRDTKTPSVAYASDAGIDFYIPNANDDFYNDLLELNHLKESLSKSEKLKVLILNQKLEIYNDKENSEIRIQIGPSSRVLIPLGIKTIFDSSMALVALNKSSIASKLGLIVGAQVIDSGYRGEIILNLINTSNVDRITLKSGDKIAQFVPLKLYDRNIQEISNENYENISNEISKKIENGKSRLEGGFGSSINK